MATKTKRKQIEQTEAKTVLNAVKDINLQTVVNDVSNLQITVQKTLADLCATVTNKVQQVEQLDTAISLKEGQLQELHNIEKEAISLDEMRAQKEEEKIAWEKQRLAQQTRWQEEEAENAKKQKRDLEQYEYDFAQKKKRIQEEFEAEVARTKRGEQLRHEALEKHWAERDAAIKAKEQEFAKLQETVAGFDTKLKTEVAKAEAILTNVLKSQHNHELALLKKDSEAAKAVADMKITALSSQIESLHNQIEDLNKQLISARQDAKEVASQALQSASNRQLAETLQKVVTDTQPTKNNK